MNNVKFYLPGAFEQSTLYDYFLSIYENERNKFYDYVEIDSVYGSSTLLIWNGGQINLSDTFLPLSKYKNLYNKHKIPVSIDASNLLLEERDLYNSTANYFLSEYNEQSNSLIIGSDILNALVKTLYQNYITISSTTKCLNENETLDELDKDYNKVELNVVLNHNFNFLNKLTSKQKEKIIIILNPTCLNFCEQMLEHYKSLSYDMIYRDTTSKNFQCEWQNKTFIEKLNSSYTIKNEEIIKKYVNSGYNNFKIINNNSPKIDIIYSLVYYLIKPEFVFEISYRLSNLLKKSDNFYSKPLEGDDE